MNALTKLMGRAAIGLAVATALTAPAFADKISAEGKNPPISTTTPESPAAPPVPEVTAAPAPSAEIDFGDDSGNWANDGECDDPRFTGEGTAAELLDADIAKDATDCRTAFEAGTVTAKDAGTAPVDIAIASPINAIDWGDDTSEYAKDNECDDPRFTGSAMGAEPLESNIRKDATDCRAAYEAGTITLKDTSAAPSTIPPVAPPTPTPAAEVDFGDDTGEWAKDGECDDPRFSGTGAADELVDADLLKDATDCRTALDAGTVTFNPDYQAGAATAQINYGDDTSEWAKDGECDDPRFSGTGVAGELVEADRGHDATDCRAAVEAGTAIYNGEDVPVATTVTPAPFDYGTDFSRWANDGECDDLRFAGTAVDKKLLTEDLYGDATDCRAAVDAGTASIRPVYTPEYATAGPYDSSAIKFGDNTSDYADDQMCDDPRFEGPGAASVVLEDDRLRDSADCKANFEAGTIVLKEGETGEA